MLTSPLWEYGKVEIGRNKPHTTVAPAPFTIDVLRVQARVAAPFGKGKPRDLVYTLLRCLMGFLVRLCREFLQLRIYALLIFLQHRIHALLIQPALFFQIELMPPALQQFYGKSNLSNEDKWDAIYRILLPGALPIPCPCKYTLQAQSCAG